MWQRDGQDRAGPSDAGGRATTSQPGRKFSPTAMPLGPLAKSSIKSPSESMSW
jgi:hypothetical protein